MQQKDKRESKRLSRLKPVSATGAWSLSEVVQLLLGVLLAIVTTALFIYLIWITADNYRAIISGEMAGTYEYGLGALFLGWIPAVMGFGIIPIAVIMWVNVFFNKFVLSLITAVLIFALIVVIGFGNSGFLLWGIFPVNVLYCILQIYHYRINKK